MVNLKYDSRAISGGKMQSLHIDTLKSQRKKYQRQHIWISEPLPNSQCQHPDRKRGHTPADTKPNQLPPPNDWNSSEDVADEITASSTNDWHYHAHGIVFAHTLSYFFIS